MAKTKVNNAQQLNTVLSQANAGSGGGTIYYINLGGVKMAWGSITVPTGGSRVVTFPSSFFSNVYNAQITFGPASGTAAVVAGVEAGGLSSSAMTVVLNAYSGAGTMSVQWFVIGN